MYNILFMGTPHIADCVLQFLIKENKYNIVGVVAQPDKPANRNQQLTPPPTKVTALNHNIKVFQPEKVRNNKEFLEEISKLNIDFMVVIAYGKILPKSILDIPKYYPINIHASLLPKYRGASPIQFCLLNREKETGVTIMKMDIGMDTGDMLLQRSVEIDSFESYSNLEEKLINLSNKTIAEFFEKFDKNEIIPVVQNHSEATYTKIIEKKDGLIDFNEDITKIYGKICAYSEWPKTYFFIDGKQYNIIKAKYELINHSNQNGLIEITKKNMKIYALNGILEIEEIQPQAKNVLKISDFFNGSGKALNGKII